MADNRRGISPVIATALLLGLAVVIGLIIFLWARSTLVEQYLKFSEPVERSCEKVNFKSEIYAENGGKNVSVLNQGNVPIYGFKLYSKTNSEFKEVQDVQCFSSDGVPITLGNGESCVRGLVSGVQSGTKVLIVPQMLAERGNQEVPYLCDKSFGDELDVP